MPKKYVAEFTQQKKTLVAHYLTFQLLSKHFNRQWADKGIIHFQQKPWRQNFVSNIRTEVDCGKERMQRE